MQEVEKMDVRQDYFCLISYWTGSVVCDGNWYVLSVFTVNTILVCFHYAGAIFRAPLPSAACSAARLLVLVALLALASQAVCSQHQ